MGISIKHVPIIVGTTSIEVLAANQDRKYLVIQNRDAAKTARVKFGEAVKAAVTEVQDITFSATPDDGDSKFTYDGVESSTALDNAEAATELQVVLRTIPALSEVTVTGTFGAGFAVTMTGVEAIDGDLPLISATTNTLEESATPVDVTVTEDTKGVFADGYFIPANGSLEFTDPDSCPLDSVNILGSAADTPLEIIHG